jgi:hypothetical protein
MATGILVQTDFIQLLARLIAASDKGQPPTKRTGNDLSCSQPALGKWIDDCDFPFLMETLALPDEVFEREFPGIRLSHQERETFAQTLNSHCKECARCHAKRAEDLEWESRVDKAFAENKETIGEFFSDIPGKP